jgi:hypothetical protein
LGTLYNSIISGRFRIPASYGIHLSFRKVIHKRKVMDTLFAVEEALPGVGKSMRDIFFPGELRQDELRRWREFEDKARTFEQKRREIEREKQTRLRDMGWNTPADANFPQPTMPTPDMNV